MIVGNAISRGNVELEYVLDQRLAYESMAQVVYDEFLAGRERLVVAGTHGKTTTSSLLAWLFTEAQRAPSFLIGGIPENFGSSFALGDGREFIIEGDEYDTAFFDKGPKFLHYFPDAVILTSVEFDHADIYQESRRGEDSVQAPGEPDSAARIAHRVGWRMPMWTSVSAARCAGWSVTASARIRRGGSRTAEYERRRRRVGGLLETAHRGASSNHRLAGEYNVLNATAAAAMAANYGMPVETIARALRSFRSVKRRLEVKAEVHGVTIIDDFAHHPTAIAGTLKALAHSLSADAACGPFSSHARTRFAAKCLRMNWPRALQLADQVVLAGVFKSDAIPEAERLDRQTVIAKLNCQRNAGAIAGHSRRHCRQRSHPNCGKATWSPSSPTADSAASMKSFRPRLSSLHEVSTPA